MLVDFDDLSETDNRLDLLELLHEANPLFRCTVFAIPSLGSPSFWESIPEWIELAVHGWSHPDSWECIWWTREQMEDVLDDDLIAYFTKGWKSPGWQSSDAVYEVLAERGWWMADHWDNDGRRPEGLRVHVISRASGLGIDPEHWHGHIPNVCGNGIEETFDTLLARVRNADQFQVMSEVVK